MKTLILICSVITQSIHLCAQNVGVGTTTPTEKLDINGNINVAGQVKINGDSGAVNQVLMKSATNTLVWGDLSGFKNLITFDCVSIASTPGTNNCTNNWTVPAGITKIFVECWGGGGGGDATQGGGGGGYISAILNVTPTGMASLSIGAGGNYGNVSVASGIIGGNTSFTLSGVTLNAFGGQGGHIGDPLVSVIGSTAANGGDFSIVGLTSQFVGYHGSPGGISKLTFMQAGATDYAKIVNYGNGGDAALLPESGSKGGYQIVSASISQTFTANDNGIQPGGGGGADYLGGERGRGGRIIIHW